MKFSYQRSFSTYFPFLVKEDNVFHTGDFSKKRKYCDLSSRILNNLINSKSLTFRSSELAMNLYVILNSIWK